MTEGSGRLGERMPAAPLEWHPFYRDKTHLLDWLKPADYTPIGVDTSGALVYEIPIRTGPGCDLSDERDVDTPRRVTLTKEKAWAPAPWTDRPYAYVWYVATDNLGRSIAGESWTVELGQTLVDQGGVA